MGKNDASSVLGAFVGGAIVGGIAALLLAPKSGSEMRDWVREFIDDELDTMKDKAGEAGDFVREGIEKIAKKAIGGEMKKEAEKKPAVKKAGTKKPAGERKKPGRKPGVKSSVKSGAKSESKSTTKPKAKSGTKSGTPKTTRVKKTKTIE